MNLIIDYDTPHGRAHTRAADIAFLLTSHRAPVDLTGIADEPDREVRADRLYQACGVRDVNYDLIRRDGGFMVEVSPEAGQTHPPVHAAVVAGRVAKSRCACPEFQNTHAED